jgi:acyl-coenzyme A thioesterase PaaI-like protein
MDEIRTHRRIDRALCGAPENLEEGSAEVVLHTTEAMAADEHGLVHGGFVFGAADHAAMLAVNDPNVVLGKAEVRFLAPVRVGDRVVARGRVAGGGREGRPRVEVEATVDGRPVLSGVLGCAVPERHVLAGAPEPVRRERQRDRAEERR